MGKRLRICIRFQHLFQALWTNSSARSAVHQKQLVELPLWMLINVSWFEKKLFEVAQQIEDLKTIVSQNEQAREAEERGEAEQEEEPSSAGSAELTAELLSKQVNDFTQQLAEMTIATAGLTSMLEKIDPVTNVTTAAPTAGEQDFIIRIHSPAQASKEGENTPPPSSTPEDFVPPNGSSGGGSSSLAGSLLDLEKANPAAVSVPIVVYSAARPLKDEDLLRLQKRIEEDKQKKLASRVSKKLAGDYVQSMKKKIDKADASANMMDANAEFFQYLAEATRERLQKDGKGEEAKEIEEKAHRSIQMINESWNDVNPEPVASPSVPAPVVPKHETSHTKPHKKK